jgi:hypothetical protein
MRGVLEALWREWLVLRDPEAAECCYGGRAMEEAVGIGRSEESQRGKSSCRNLKATATKRKIYIRRWRGAMPGVMAPGMAASHPGGATGPVYYSVRYLQSKKFC